MLDRDVEIGDLGGGGNRMAGDAVQVGGKEVEGKRVVAEVARGLLQLGVGAAHPAHPQ